MEGWAMHRPPNANAPQPQKSNADGRVEEQGLLGRNFGFRDEANLFATTIQKSVVTYTFGTSCSRTFSAEV